MHVNMEQGNLLRGLEHTLGVIDKRGTLPILAHCLVEANGQGLVISATDLEMSFRGAFPAEVVEPGTFTVKAQAMHSLVKSLPKGDLEVTGDENRIKLVAGESRYKFLALPAEQFPSLPKVMEDDLVEVEAGVLVDLINKTIFSVGEDLQYHLQAVQWERADSEDGPCLRLVSTDGHRLSLADGRLPGLERLEAINGILVPTKAMREIKRFAEQNAKDGKIKLGLMWPSEEQGSLLEETNQEDKADQGPPRFLCLKAGDQELSVRLMDRKFPEYRRIIPESWENRFDFSRQALMEALRRVSSLSTDRFKGVVLTLGDKEMEITFDSPEVGRGREVVEILERGADVPEPLKLGFNARYLLEPLAVMKGERVVLDFNEPGRPVRLKDPADPLASWLVMPMDT
jgi:DNA polymerase III subunit beta